MSMDRSSTLAFDIAKEITVACVSHAEINVSATAGETTAAFFEAVYNKVKQLADAAER